jgi:hypothetical protein
MTPVETLARVSDLGSYGDGGVLHSQRLEYDLGTTMLVGLMACCIYFAVLLWLTKL